MDPDLVNTINKSVKMPRTLIIAFFLFTACFFYAVPAQSSNEKEMKGGETEFIMHHVKDSHEWHFASIGHTHITLPLPVIIFESGHGLRFYMSSDFVDEHHNAIAVDGYSIDENQHIVSTDPERKFYDISITKNVTTLFLSVILLFVVFLTTASGYKKDPLKPPTGIQSFMEPIILFVRDEIARPTIGEKNYERFMPYLLSVFFFIWFNNLMGLLPGAANLTGNIAVTMTLALFTFVVTNVSANKEYWIHIFNTPGVPWWLKIPVPLMPFVEFIGILTKPFSLMVRLFANITAGHIIILSLIALVFIFHSATVGIVSVLFGLFMNMIELLVAFIQAFVFTLLSAIYFGLATEEHEHEERHQEQLENITM